MTRRERRAVQWGAAVVCAALLARAAPVGIESVRARRDRLIQTSELLVRSQRRGGRPVTLDELGMPTDTLAAFKRLAERPHGIVLATGPTGSGKTTTLYAALGLRHATGEKIICESAAYLPKDLLLSERTIAATHTRRARVLITLTPVMIGRACQDLLPRGFR